MQKSQLSTGTRVRVIATVYGVAQESKPRLYQFIKKFVKSITDRQ